MALLRPGPAPGRDGPAQEPEDDGEELQQAIHLSLALPTTPPRISMTL
jgi:hypothetical protein